MVDAA